MKTIQIKKIAYYLFLGVLTVLFTNCSKDDPKTPEPQQILGCTDPDANNYNPDATDSDNSCTYTIVGCMNPDASNYDPDATEDGYCEIEGCTDPNALNYNPDANAEDSTCLYNCTDPLAENFNEDAESDNGTCSYSGDLTIQFTENPETYTRKILLEPVVGTDTGWSVDVPVRLDALNENFENIIVSNIYNGNGNLSHQLLYIYVYETFGVNGIPTGMVNRRKSISSEDYVMSRSEWESNVAEQSGETANMGLAISSRINNNDELEVFVEAGFRASENSVSLNVYLLEDGLVEPQDNNYSFENGSQYEGHPFYEEEDPINDYIHNNVFREALTPLEGLEISDEVVAEQRKFQRMFKVSDLSSYNKDNLKIVAFVAKNGGTVDQKYVLNAQQLAVNGDGTLTVQDYD
ncbi:Omp28-related outer membrane protein [Flagellimonas sp.]|uniref:Omp28-related outer membrane protein n=1 Tax=Flagellimonas sp. TaxID=2058762 RepID=UPI003B523D38